MPALTFNDDGVVIPKAFKNATTAPSKALAFKPDGPEQDLPAIDAAKRFATRAPGLAARATTPGILSAVAGTPAIIADSLLGVGRDTVYGAKKAGAYLGLNEEPDPKNYYDESKGAFPIVGDVAKAGQEVGDKLNLPTPENATERMYSAGTEGLIGSLGPGGLAARLAGVGGGLASQGAAELGGSDKGILSAGLAGSILPMLLMSKNGRQTIKSQAGQEAVAGKALRERASDVGAAASSIDTMGDRLKIAGYRLRGTDAARDRGLAAIAPSLRNYANEYAGGAERALVENNSSVLSRALDANIGEGSEAARAAQTAEDAARIRAMKDNVSDEHGVINLSKMERDLAQGSDLRLGGRQDKGKAFSEMRTRLRDAAFPIYDHEGIRGTGRGRVAGYQMPAENALDMRSDWSQDMRPGSISTPNNSPMKNVKREIKPFMNQLDEKLEAAYPGHFSEYLKQSRQGRNIADAKEYTEDFAKKVHKGGMYNPDGSRVIDEPAWLATVNKKGDVPLPSGNRSVSLEKVEDRLRPTTGQFLRDAASDINEGSYAARTNMQGSPTNSKANFDTRVNELVMEGQGPFAKLFGATASGIGATAGAGARLTGGKTGSILYTAQKAANKIGDKLVGESLDKGNFGVRSILGRAEADPAYMAELLRREKARNPGLAATLAIQGYKGATRGAPQGFLASERTKRYR